MAEAVTTHRAFLQWAMPRLHLRYAGFRRNTRQVLHRIDRRRAALGLADLDAYRDFLEAHPGEWTELDALCRVTISRFARDRAVWDHLVAVEFPHLARRATVRAWSAGCGAGEEPYTLAIAWQLVIGTPLEIIATDRDDTQLRRAAVADYPLATLRELPDDWQRAAFDGGRLRDRFRGSVTFLHHDLRTAPPAGRFDLVLCRNLAYSYFDDEAQRAVTARFHDALTEGGILVVGKDETLPAGAAFTRVAPCIYRRT